MLIRRTALTFGFLALVAGCSDNSGNTGPAPQPADAPGPHFPPVGWSHGPPSLRPWGLTPPGWAGGAGALPRRPRPGGGTGGEWAAAARRPSTGSASAGLTPSAAASIGSWSSRLRSATRAKSLTGVTYQGKSLTPNWWLWNTP